MASKGLVGVLDGFFPWGFAQALAKGAVFSAGQAASLNLLRSTGLSPDACMVLSGGIGGAVQGLAMSPLLLLKTRVMTDARFRGSGGALATAVASARVGSTIVATEGPAALFKGVQLFALKRALDWTTRYLFVVCSENALRRARGLGPRERLSGADELLAGCVGGALSSLSTIPMDVAVAATQSAGAAGKAGSGFVAGLRAQVAREGVWGTLRYSCRGLMARTVHVTVTTLAMKNGTSWVYSVLYPPQLA